jgi:hypothetical protein
MTLWDSHSQSAGKGTFQMGSVRDGGDGTATLRTAALQLHSTQVTTDCFWFFHYSSSNTKVSQASVDLLFNAAAYEEKDASGNSAKSLVEEAVVATSNAFISQPGNIE